MISNEPQTLAHDPEAIIDQYILEANTHPVESQKETCGGQSYKKEKIK